MSRPGSINVSERFNSVLFFGVIANFCAIAYFSFFRNKDRLEYGISSIFLGLTVYLALFIQYLLIFLFRFSHSGKVCSGDFNTYFETQIYEDYFLKSQGKFLYYFGIISVTLFSVGFCCLGFCTTCMLIGENSESYHNIE